jgi:CRP-like cAMP-binding protein
MQFGALRNIGHTPRRFIMSTHPLQNRLLGALPPRDLARILPHMERVELPRGKVLHESGCRPGYAYFPTTAIVSMYYMMKDGATAEIAAVGSEGLIGVGLFMGGGSTTHSAVVQNGGEGYRIKAHFFFEECSRSGVTLQLMMLYAQALLVQTSQVAVCNCHHSLDQQVCRWLLLYLDRLESNEIVVTQEMIAHMLGVRREGVTVVACKLQIAGFIRYKRGRIIVIDRTGLERRACECYAVVKHEYDRLLPSSFVPSSEASAIAPVMHSFVPPE